MTTSNQGDTLIAEQTGSCPCGSCHRPCTAQPDTCPEHGPDCDPTDHFEPPTVNGEDQ
ncbi:hypothetical protein [Streptomyces sp. NPDC006863]|uniref:hypothetical protein n=1 Tax=Streptomyces sp. NPDC006863 TaxID=3154779 RepID=UPI0033E1D061